MMPATTAQLFFRVGAGLFHLCFLSVLALWHPFFFVGVFMYADNECKLSRGVCGGW